MFVWICVHTKIKTDTRKKYIKSDALRVREINKRETSTHYRSIEPCPVASPRLIHTSFIALMESVALAAVCDYSQCPPEGLHTQSHALPYAHTHTLTRTHTRMHSCTHAHANTNTHTHTHMHTQTNQTLCYCQNNNTFDVHSYILLQSPNPKPHGHYCGFILFHLSVLFPFALLFGGRLLVQTSSPFPPTLLHSWKKRNILYNFSISHNTG